MVVKKGCRTLTSTAGEGLMLHNDATELLFDDDDFAAEVG